MKIERRFTKAGKSAYSGITFRKATSEIKNPNGARVFALEGFEVPDSWSQVAADVLAQKYFRKAGVAAKLKPVEEEGVPSWLWRSVPDETALAELPEGERFGGEIPETYGVPVEQVVEGIKHGVRKVNIDTDLRLASTGAIRRFLAENPAEFDPRKYLKESLIAMRDICSARFEAFGCAGHASKITPLPLSEMQERYSNGSL